MTLVEAIQILVDCAGRWGENVEEAFSRRIQSGDTDDVLGELVADDDELSDAIEVRDLWRAVDVALANFNKPIEGAPR